MTTGAIHSLITADNSDFRAAIAAVEGDTSRVMGRVGAIVKTNVRGYKDLSGAVLGTVGVIGLIGAGVGAATRSVLYLIDTQERVNRLVREERQEREAVVRAAQRGTMALETRLGLRSDRSEFDSVRSSIDRLVEERTKLSEKQLELQQTASGYDNLGIGFIRDFFGGYTQRAKEAATDVEKLNELIDRQIDLLKKADEVDRRRALNAKIDREYRKIGLDLSFRSGISANSGDRAESERLRERDRYAQQLEQIRRMEEEDGYRYSQLRLKAEEFHKSEMDRIGREAGERERLAERSAKYAGMEADAQEQRLLGHEKESRRIEEQLRYERAREAIRERAGLTESERTARLTQADRIHALQIAELDKPDHRPVSASIEAGAFRSPSLVAQVFGGINGPSQKPAQESTAAKSLNVQSDMLKTLNRIADKRSVAVFA